VTLSGWLGGDVTLRDAAGGFERSKPNLEAAPAA
jgi:hypothetical protein